MALRARPAASETLRRIAGFDRQNQFARERY
jgi:hypothetical protein